MSGDRTPQRRTGTFDDMRDVRRAAACIRVVCAEHGHSPDGVQVSCRETRHDENKIMKILAEVKVRRVIGGLKEDYARPASR